MFDFVYIILDFFWRLLRPKHYEDWDKQQAPLPPEQDKAKKRHDRSGWN